MRRPPGFRAFGPVPFAAGLALFSRRRRRLRPRSGPWCRRTSTMSLSRSEEMHRLTENVYKVSPPPPRAGARPGRPRDPRGSPRRGRSPVAGAGAPAPTAPGCPRAPLRAPLRSPRTRVEQGHGRGAAASGGCRGPRPPLPVVLRPGRRGGSVVAPLAVVTQALGTFFSTGVPFTTPSRELVDLA